MNNVIITFMDEYRPSKNNDEKDIQVFLKMLKQLIVTTFYNISTIKNGKI